MSNSQTIGAAPPIEALIQQRLALLEPVRLEVIDDSARHAGHAGAQGRGGHYRLLIVSDAFAGQARLARHRMLHDLLADLLHARIHALSIQALTPAEALSAAACSALSVS